MANCSKIHQSQSKYILLRPTAINLRKTNRTTGSDDSGPSAGSGCDVGTSGFGSIFRYRWTTCWHLRQTARLDQPKRPLRAMSAILRIAATAAGYRVAAPDASPRRYSRRRRAAAGHGRAPRVDVRRRAVGLVHSAAQRRRRSGRNTLDAKGSASDFQRRTDRSFSEAYPRNLQEGDVLLHHFGCAGLLIATIVGLGRRGGESAASCTSAGVGA